MKAIIFVVVLLITGPLFSQPNVQVYHEKTQNGYAVYVDNEEYCPVSVDLNFSLKNLNSTQGNNKVFVIPANIEKYHITDLVVINDRKKYQFNILSRTNFGDHNQNEYDQDFEYYLPFEEGRTFLVGQGYNGSASHRNINALDFEMKIGEEVHAARGGIVVDVVESNSRHCVKKECEKYNNYILIYHDDGSFADYAHIKKNGSAVKIGERVNTGQLIAFSGNVGYSSGPHLHFAVFLQKIKKRESLKTLFLVGNGDEAVFLNEDKEYTRDY